MEFRYENVRLLPLATAGLALGVWEVAVRPAIVDTGRLVLEKLEEHNILRVDFGHDK